MLADIFGSSPVQPLEKQTDPGFRAASLTKELSGIEPAWPPVEAVIRNRNIEQVGGLAGAAERTGRRLDVLVAR